MRLIGISILDLVSGSPRGTDTDGERESTDTWIESSNKPISFPISVLPFIPPVHSIWPKGGAQEPSLFRERDRRILGVDRLFERRWLRAVESITHLPPFTGVHLWNLPANHHGHYHLFGHRYLAIHV